MSNEIKDYYKILGVSESATKEEIEKAYRSLSKKWHPDICKEANAKEKFQEINEAHDTLKDEGKRNLYDFQRKNGGRDPRQNMGGHWHFSSMDGEDSPYMNGFDDMDDMMFGHMGGFGHTVGGFHRSKPQIKPKYQKMSGEDILIRTEISFFDAIYGTKKTFDNLSIREKCEHCHGVGTKNGDESLFEKCPTCDGYGIVQQRLGPVTQISDCLKCRGRGWLMKETCSYCNGFGFVTNNRTLEMKIPAGIISGTNLRADGCSHCGLHGGPKGDIIINVTVRPSENFEINGLNVYTSALTDPFTAILGGEIDVLTPYGYAKMNIPAGSMAGQKFRMRGSGIPIPNNPSQLSDLIVTLEIDTPDKGKLSKKQLETIKKFQDDAKDSFTRKNLYKSLSDKILKEEIEKRKPKK